MAENEIEESVEKNPADEQMNSEQKAKTEGNASVDKKKNVGQILKEYLDKGVEASKKGFNAASKAISEFGDKSVLQIELTQLKSKLTKTYAELGDFYYNGKKNGTYSEEKEKEIFAQIDKINEDIGNHEFAIKQSDSSAK